MSTDSIFHYDAMLRCLICKTHGYAVQPNPGSIVRHLRGKDHSEGGTRLKSTLRWCMQLPLCAQPNEVWSSNSTLHTPPYLRVLGGYSCELCPEDFLTTSLELMHKHATKNHADDVRYQPWEPCKLVTLFKETKHRHYRRLSERHQPILASASASQYIDNGTGTFRYNIADCHSMAATAARYVRCIPLSTMNKMFKSTSFRTISRPLFSPGRIDSDNAVFNVFPGSDLDPLFFQALVYALIRVCSEHIVPRTQYLWLERVVVRQLNERIQSFDTTRHISVSTIGVLLLLKLAAYKIGDTIQHNIHARGVKAALSVSDRNILPEALQRAIFWQDLYAAVLVQSQRMFTDFMMFESFDSLPDVALPIGFSRIASQLGQDLCNCIVDTIRFDRERKEICQQTWSSRYRRLDGLQASIESRLQYMTGACRQCGAIAEIVRLATLFWCYCSWMEVWNDPLVPCRILHLMLDVLERSLSAPQAKLLWQSHLDLLYWLMFMLADIIEIENWHTRQIAPRYYDLLRSADSLCSKTPVDELRMARHQAESDFVPNPPWRRHRYGEAPLFA